MAEDPEVYVESEEMAAPAVELPASEAIVAPPQEGDALEELAGDEFQISRVFYDSYKAYSELLKAPERTSPTQEEVDNLLKDLKALAWHVDQLHLFSVNEELEDLNTTDLKYLMVPFLLAEVYNATVDMDQRLDAVKAAMVCFRTFAARAERYGVADVADLRALGRCPEDRLTLEDKRAEKIDRYKRSKDLDQKINYMFAKRRQFTGDKYLWSSELFDEDFERSLILSLLSRSMAATADAVRVAEEELPMLEIMKARGGLGKAPPKPEPSKEKPWVIRIQDKAELHKLYLQQVFQPDIPMPTMTLAEAADIEMAEMKERTESKKRGEFMAAYEDQTAWFEGDRSGAKEDYDADLKTFKDRDWDDWKDEHPFGSGNKGGNLG